MLKLIIILIVAYLWWRIWKAPRKKPGARSGRPPAPVELNDSEALAVLGLERHAGDDEIRAAHRRLIAAVHPDRGGSPDLARRINAARDVLLRRN